MTTHKDNRNAAKRAISRAIGELMYYSDELEADEDFGPVYDGSTFQQDLMDVLTGLMDAQSKFRTAHATDHFGLGLTWGEGG